MTETHLTKHIIHLTLVFFAFISSLTNAEIIPKTHAIAMHGSAKYSAEFKHFDYVNPAAPKGGELRLPVVSGSGFDSLNPFIIKGVPAAGMTYLRQSYLYDSLGVHADDEPFSIYGLIAESMEIPDDRSFITFNLHPQARFQDGRPITAEDVIYTFELLTQQGHPLFSNYYKDVAKVEALNSHSVKFSFSTNKNKELPLILAEMPVLPKHFWQQRDFSKTSLEIPLGSGPYHIESIDPGRSIIYGRNPDYWAKDLPVNKGRYNFDRIKFDYYRDENVAIEALKSGEYDLRAENSAKNWASAYTGPQFDSGQLIKVELPDHNPTGMQAFTYNTRRSIFKDPKVREALAYAFDFEWTNQNIFYGAYTRTHSYFSNSELAATELPSPTELAILEPYKAQLPPEVFTTLYQPPTTKGDGNIRSNIRHALNLLKQAGWQIKNNKLTHLKTGQEMAFEILLVSPTFERVVLPFKKNLARLGIDMTVSTIDPQQYINRINEFNFDMVVSVFGQSNSPGNEQRDYWNSTEADRPGSRNIIGIKDPVVDALIEQIISAPDREALVARTRALDRVLLWGHYVIPQFHNRSYRIAYWNKFERPQIMPKYSLGIDTWWAKP